MDASTPLVVIEALQINGEPALHRLVEKIRLGESELYRAQARADLRAQAERLAQAEEIVRRIGSADKASGDARHAAVQLNGVLAAFFHLQRDVHGVGLGIALDVGRLFFLQRLEVAELVQAQDAEVPQPGVEQVAFVDQQLAANHFIASGRVAGEIDAADEELLALVDGQIEVHFVRAAHWLRIGLHDEIDVPEFAVQLAHILYAFAQLGGGERIARRHLEQRAHERLRRPEELHSGKRDIPQRVLVAFVDVYRDVGGLAGLFGEEQEHTSARRVHGLRFGAFHARHEESVFLIEHADALLILVQFRLIERLREQVLEKDRIGDPDGAQVLHRTNHRAVVLRVVAFDIDLPHLHLGPLVYFEHDVQGGRRNGLNLGGYRGVLTAALGEQFEQHVLRSLHFGRIVLRFHGKADLALLVAVQNIGNANRLVAFVGDGPDHGPLFHDESNDPSGFARLPFELQVVQPAGVPQRHEIAMKHRFVQFVARPADHQGAQRVLRNAPGTANLDGLDHVRNSAGRGRLWLSLRGILLRRRCGLLRSLRHVLEWILAVRLLRRFLLLLLRLSRLR